MPWIAQPSSLLSLLLLLGLLFALHVHRRRMIRRRELMKTFLGLLLRHCATGEVAAPIGLPQGQRWHLFLSHAWATGQDRMRIIKDRLKMMLPELEVFLDVDVRSPALPRPVTFVLPPDPRTVVDGYSRRHAARVRSTEPASPTPHPTPPSAHLRRTFRIASPPTPSHKSATSSSTSVTGEAYCATTERAQEFERSASP